MNIALELRHDPDADHAAAAWFFPGQNASWWLDELARCGLAEAATRLFVVPRGPDDPRSAGLLVVPAEGTTPRVPPAATGCRRLAGHLYVPLDARLYPPVTETELRQLCPWPLAFFHPTLGLTPFSEESSLHVWHLLQRPQERVTNWNFARHGPPSLPPLTAIVLATPPTLDDVFGGAQDEIATQPLDDLPAAPDEPSQQASAKSRRYVERLITRALAEAIRRVPHLGQRRTWLNNLEDWAQRHLQRVDEQLQRLRNKELHRLLNLLDSDPEAGLRHAIPMNSFAHRGLAPPGGRLRQRDPHFDPQRLGGLPADFWDVPADIQELLRRRYREMADREMHLGRYRRAAYIYAELLGDLVSAAHALKQGRLFREAALLYEDQLHNPLEAARCLAEGGLLREAIERYEKLERWLEAADLHERLGDHAAATKAVRRVVDECLRQGDILGAAKLVDDRLQLPDEAIDLLRGAWPDSRQAAASTGVLFQLLARLGRHELARDRVREFARDPIPTPLALPLLNALATPARDYPDHDVRHGLADFSRVLISRELTRTGLAINEADRLMHVLVQLAPEDRLLARDANRHLAERRNAELSARRLAPPVADGPKPVIVRNLKLPREIEWLQLRSEWHWFYALGVTPKYLMVVRGIWEGQFQSLSWDWPGHVVKQAPLVFEPTAERGKSVALQLLGCEADVPNKIFPATDLLFNRECTVGSLPWMPPAGVASAFGEDAVWTAQRPGSKERLILSCHDKQGHLQRTLDVTTELLAEPEPGSRSLTSLRLCVLEQGCVAAFGNRVLLTGAEGKLTVLELPGKAIGLCPTRPRTRPGVAVMLDHGAVMHWRDTEELIELDRDLPSPLGTFVPGGPFVLVSGQRGILLEVDSRGVHLITRFDIDVPRPVGLRTTANPGQFAILASGGELIVYQVPR